MRKIGKLLTPKVLAQLDEYLLVNRPLLWASRLHYVVYFCIIELVALFFIVRTLPISHYRIFSPEMLSFLCNSFNLLIFIIWMRRQAMFDILYQYGNDVKSFSRQSIFLSFSVIMLLILNFLLAHFYLLHRISKELLDPKLPKIIHVNVAQILANDLRTNYIDSMAYTDSNQVAHSVSWKTYHNLSKEEKHNVFMGLRGQNFSNCQFILGGNDKRDAYFQYSPCKDDLLESLKPKDSLIIYYNRVVVDTVRSDVFKQFISSWWVSGSIKYRTDSSYHDTLLNRLYFINNRNNGITFSQPNTLQLDLTKDLILKRLENDRGDDKRKMEIYNVLDPILASESIDVVYRLFMGFVAGLIFFSLFFYCAPFLKLFGWKPFGRALVLFALIIIGILFLSAYMDKIVSPVLLLVSIPVCWLYFNKISRRASWRLVVCLAVAFYLIILLLFLQTLIKSTFSIFEVDPSVLKRYDSEMACIMIFLYLAFSVNYIYKLYSLYSRPGEE